MPNSSKTALILGANGSFGSHAAMAFANANWTVLAQTRPGKPLNAELNRLPNITPMPIDLKDDTLMASAAKQADIIVNGLNPPYGQWATAVPTITKAVLKATQTGNVTLILPGNVYNYGDQMPALLNAQTSHSPTTNLGEIRVTLEQAYQQASEKGVQIIILRMGDFLSPQKSDNWFDSQMTGGLPKGKFTYPGDATIPHAWAYLPDAARALVQLAGISDRLPMFSDIPFEGTTLTGEQMALEIEKVLGRRIKTSGTPWPILKFISLFSGDLRGVIKMRYLWDTPHALDGTALQRLLPDFQATSTEEIIRACVARYV